MPEASANESTPTDKAETSKRQASSIAILDPSRALASEEAFNEQADQWRTILDQGVLPKSTDTPAKCIAIAKLGLERFGWGAMDSVTKMCLVEGKIELCVETMMGLIQDRACRTPGEYAMPVERSLDRAAIAVKRSDWPKEFTFEFTQEDAKHAGLWGRTSSSGRKMPWSSYEKDMLWARCVSRVSRGAFSDVTGGAYAIGEVDSSVTVVQIDQLSDDLPLSAALAPADDADFEESSVMDKLSTITEDVAEQFTDGDLESARSMVMRRANIELSGHPSDEQVRALIGAAGSLLQDTPPA